MIPAGSGDEIPAGASLIELRVPELRRLFNQLDPSPFYDQDLDPNAEEYIVELARELPRDAPLALVVHVGRGPGELDEAGMFRDAVQRHFQRRRDAEDTRLRRLFRIGRINLAIGTSFLMLAILFGAWLRERLSGGYIPEMLDASLIIGGWVAMWRPIEIFLYDWWPILGDKKRCARLSRMPVRLIHATGAGGVDWRRDWPATQAGSLEGLAP